MDTLKDKQFGQFDYLCRYTTVPYYFDTIDKREIFGIGSNLQKDTAWMAYKVKQTDTWDGLALTFYNNPTLWWVIAYFNDVIDPFAPIYKRYSVVKIPNISDIEFGFERQ